MEDSLLQDDREFEEPDEEETIATLRRDLEETQDNLKREHGYNTDLLKRLDVSERKVKLFEIRDSATFIPAIAIKVSRDGFHNGFEQFLLSRAGFGQDRDFILLARLHGNGGISYDPYSWTSSRTMGVAHQYIIEHYNELEHGAVIDVEYILGITTEPKRSEFYLKEGQ